MSENSTGNVDALWGALLSPEKDQALVEALLAARAAHPDFEALENAMATCGRALRPDWTRITVPEFIELLYCCVKYSNFTAPVRDELLLAATGANGETQGASPAVVEAPTPDSFGPVDRGREGARAKVADITPATDQERLQRQFCIYAEARASVLARHADLDSILPAMDVLAGGLTMNPNGITPADYLEALYVVAKTANFAAPLREQILQKAVPEGGAYRM